MCFRYEEIGKNAEEPLPSHNLASKNATELWVLGYNYRAIPYCWVLWRELLLMKECT